MGSVSGIDFNVQLSSSQRDPAIGAILSAFKIQFLQVEEWKRA